MEVRGNGLCLQESSSVAMVPFGANTWRIDLVYNANEYGLYCPGNQGAGRLLTGNRPNALTLSWSLIQHTVISMWILQAMTLNFGFTILALMALNNAWRALMSTGYQLPSLRCLQTLKETHLFSHSTLSSLPRKVGKCQHSFVLWRTEVFNSNCAFSFLFASCFEHVLILLVMYILYRFHGNIVGAEFQQLFRW